MAPVGLLNVVGRLRRDAAAPDDGELLERFVADRDEAAFAALVARHGPKVYAVCRRVLGRHQLAEDAFQATFLVLARKAHTVRPRSAVGGFLYGVARKAAFEASAVSRRRKETLVGTPPESPTLARGGVEPDVLAMLDEEIARLSDPLRAVVVLCELDGVRRAAAARQLGIAEGTLSSRLAAARKQLAARLHARGVTFSVALFATLAASATATPPAIPTATATAVAIAGGVMRSLMLAKLKPAVASAALLIALAAWTIMPTAAPVASAAPVPKATADPGVVWVYNWQTGKLLAYRPNEDKLKEYALPYQSRFHGLTPDGKRFVYAAEPGGKVPDKPNLFEGKLTLHTRDVGDGTPATDLGVEERLAAPVVWAPDGSRFYRFDQATTASPKHLVTVFDASGKEEKQIELQGDWPIGWAPDGKGVMLSTMYRMKPPKTTTVSRLTLADGTTEKLFEGDYFDLPQLSPDGKALLGFDNFRPAADDVRPNKAVVRYDLASGKLEDVARREKQGYATGLWSPDGNRVAYRWCEVRPNKNGTTDGDWHIVVSDKDGKNEVKLFTDSESRTAMSTMVIAWTPTPPALKDVKDTPPDSRKRNAPVPKAAPSEGVIVASKMSFKPPGEVLEVLDTAGKSLAFLPAGDLMNVQRSRVSPDGKRLAFVRFIPIDGKQRGQYHYPQDVYVVDLPLTKPPKGPTFKGVLDPQIAWADGNTLYLTRVADGTDVSQEQVTGKVLPRKAVRYDATTKKETEVALPDGHEAQDVSPDGKTLLTRIKVWNGGFGKTGYTSFLVPLDTLKAKRLGDEDDGFEIARFSPDGTRVVGIRTEYSKSSEVGVFVVGVKNGKAEQVPLAKEVVKGLVNGCVAWAPDGKRLAVLWEEAKNVKGGGPNPDRVKRIMVTDVDGKNEKTIRTFQPDESVLHIEWADPKLPAAENEGKGK